MRMINVFIQLFIVLVLMHSGQAAASMSHAQQSPDLSNKIAACHSHNMNSSDNHACSMSESNNKSCCKVECHCSTAGCTTTMAIIQSLVLIERYNTYTTRTTDSTALANTFSTSLFRPPISS
jgi:hypothetical protein